MVSVSIIVPIYNTEKYLKRCIDSLLNQTYSDIELVLVDDGSTDKSGEICDSYSAIDSRVHVFHKQNGGEASARNAGIIHASGDYIAFCDSDDEYTSDAISTLLQKADDNADIIVGAYLEINNNATRIAVANRQTYTVFDAVSEMLSSDSSYSTNYILSTINGKLYKNDIIRENQLLFDEKLTIGNDTIFNLNYFNFCNKIENVFSPTYIYYKYDTGERIQGMTWTYADNFLFYLEAKNKQLHFVNEKSRIPYYQKFIDNLIRWLVVAAVYEEYFDGRLYSLLETTINSELVCEAIKHYKCIRISDSTLIPKYILEKDAESLLAELRNRAELYTKTNGKSNLVRMIY